MNDGTTAMEKYRIIPPRVMDGWMVQRRHPDPLLPGEILGEFMYESDARLFLAALERRAVEGTRVAELKGESEQWRLAYFDAWRALKNLNRAASKEIAEYEPLEDTQIVLGLNGREHLVNRRPVPVPPELYAPDPDDITDCPRCDGTGIYQRFPSDGEKPCSICNGTGKLGPDGLGVAPAPTNAQHIPDESVAVLKNDPRPRPDPAKGVTTDFA